MLPVRGLADYEQAAALYRLCRGAGETIRRLTDCVIATVAIRVGVPLLHAEPTSTPSPGTAPWASASPEAAGEPWPWSLSGSLPPSLAGVPPQAV